MKKNFIITFVFVAFISLIFCGVSIAQTDFSKALRTCETYRQDGSITHNGEVFNLTITLDKSRNKCVYKEKIYQGKKYQMLTCNFDSGQLPAMADSMDKFTNYYKKEIAKNKIFEAKMTTNGEVFQKYLANPKYCTITHSKN